MDFTAKLMLSILIFAPGAVLLTMWLFVGLIAMLEKTGVFEAMQHEEKQQLKDAKSET